MFSTESIPITASEMTVVDSRSDSHVCPNSTMSQPHQSVSTEISPPASALPTESPASSLASGTSSNPSKPLDSSIVSSFLAPSPRPRSEYFYPDELKVMLEEVGRRKHLLLSPSPSTNRLKRRAWEEVAANVAARWPHSTRRTADQVKKKWENLVSMTKRKIRAGHVTPELDWSETNSTVVEYLAYHSPLVKLRYANAWAQSQFGPYGFAASDSLQDSNMLFQQNGPHIADDTSQRNIKAEPIIPSDNTSPYFNRDLMSQTPPEPTMNNPSGRMSMDSLPSHLSQECTSHAEVPQSIPHAGTASVNKHTLLSANPFQLSAPISGLCEPNPLLLTGAPEVQKQLRDHLTKEHTLRLEILGLQKRAWELQVELLQRTLNEQSVRVLNGSVPFVSR